MNQQTEIHPINFAVNAYKSRSPLVSAERLLNGYAEPTPLDSPFKGAVVFNTPNPVMWKEFDAFNPVYGMLVMGDYLYVVIGLTLYRVSNTKIVTILGVLDITPDKVMMTQNGVQLTILTNSGVSYYYNNLTNAFGQIVDPDYQLASSVDTLDGYTVFSKQDSGQFFVSALNDTTSYSALDFATAEAVSDNIVRVVVYNRNLFIFGSSSIEVWYNTGNLTFPLQRVDGVLIQRGLGAKLSTAIEADGIYFVGEDKVVYRIRGYSHERISNYAIEDIISKYKTVKDITGFIYTQNGHKFYVLTSPSARQTLVYDLTTQLWHERGSFNSTQTNINEWICGYHVDFNELNIVNGRKNGELYYLDLNTYTEDGVPVIFEAISCTQFDNYNYKFIDRLGVMMDFGVGIDGNEQGKNPQIMMRFSIDGAYTWSDWTEASIGDIGGFPTELYWERLGKCRSIIIQLRISDPVKRTIVGAYLKTKQGAF